MCKSLSVHLLPIATLRQFESFWPLAIDSDLFPFILFFSCWLVTLLNVFTILFHSQLSLGCVGIVLFYCQNYS